MSSETAIHETAADPAGRAMSDLLSADVDCSGIVLVDGKRACKHGFPYHPSCDSEPMKPGVYKNAPCMNERTAARLYPDTGKPGQLGR